MQSHFIIIIVKSIKVKWVGHVAGKRKKKRIHTNICNKLHGKCSWNVIEERDGKTLREVDCEVKDGWH